MDSPPETSAIVDTGERLEDHHAHAGAWGQCVRAHTHAHSATHLPLIATTRPRALATHVHDGLVKDAIGQEAGVVGHGRREKLV